MGCDIHLHYEIKEGNEWKYIDWKKDLQSEDKDYYTELSNHPLYVGRNYNLFSILANVRNGYGFAMCNTSAGFAPIDFPRGLPDDISDEVKEEAEIWGVDAHSHSWLYLQELLEYGWDIRTVTLIGVVNKREYIEFKKNGRPSSWSGEVSGKFVKNISNSEMEDLLSSDEKTKTHYYTQVCWDCSYREAVGESWFKTLDELSKLGDPNNIRLVFWFDN